jgi:hypothetical protein
MFTLRRISGNGAEINHFLGESYTYIDRWNSPEEFEKCYKTYSGDTAVPKYDPESEDADKRIFGFISSSHPVHYFQPLWANQKAYIMTDGGKTFANLAYWNK